MSRCALIEYLRTPVTTQKTPQKNLPEHWPAWAKKFAELYFSGTTAMFVLHGNVSDLYAVADAKFGSLNEFLATEMFGRWELVLGFDLARGLRPLGGGDAKRQLEMVALLSRKLADPKLLPKDPTTVLALLDRYVNEQLTNDAGEQLSSAIVIDYASFLVPAGDRLQGNSAQHLVTLLNWASNPYIKRANIAFILIDSRLSDVHERLTSSAHVATLELPLPDETVRAAWLENQMQGSDVASYSDFDAPTLAKLTAGTSLTDLDVLVRSSRETGQRLDDKQFKARKKTLIERQAQGLLEFIEPKFGLDRVVGHEAAKKRLKEDAELLRLGRLDVAPMGYLFNGPVGTGKTFLATCLAGSIGIPCVQLKNFRSKYVGETEGNLERVLSVLRGMGPVMVIIDEADTMLGDRESGGDSGVGSRVFGMIANAMGNTEYRGKIVWMLLTARPDLLPVDIKRQGRAEIHVPLFYPQSQAEIKQYFSILAKKFDAVLPVDAVPDVAPEHVGHLSGADIEALVGRAWRNTLLASKTALDSESIENVLAGFMPSTQTVEREMQELAAIIECTEREFLVPSALAKLAAAGGREGLQKRFKMLTAQTG
jgi:SpoVK/Ycf46/Vps4 family AAA+-type ATPase